MSTHSKSTRSPRASWPSRLAHRLIAWFRARTDAELLVPFFHRLFDMLPVAREAVVESMRDAVYVLDTHDRLVDQNPAACRQLGRSAEEIVGRPAAEVFAAWPDLLAHYLGCAEARTELTVTVGGERHHIDLHIQPLRDRRGQHRGRVIVVRDITELWQHRAHLEELVRARTAELVSANEQLRREIAERERLEARFLQAQKLEALGQLAGGVAHDFNNLLTVILGGAEQILGDPVLSDTSRQDTEQIYLAARRGTALTHQLLAFSRQQVLEPRRLDLNRVVVEMGQLLQRLIGEGIELAIRPAPDLGQVYADPGRLGQVIMNLALNARDAMPAGGRLTIETANTTLSAADTCAQLGARCRPYVALTVSDTGVGMDAATRAQIFEPFFTTKAPGKGTGLGLTTVQGIVTQSGGHIQVLSEPGRGTAFTIYLPHTDAAEQAPSAEEHAVGTRHSEAPTLGGSAAQRPEERPARLGYLCPARTNVSFSYR